MATADDRSMPNRCMVVMNQGRPCSKIGEIERCRFCDPCAHKMTLNQKIHWTIPEDRVEFVCGRCGKKMGGTHRVVRFHPKCYYYATH